MISIAQLTSMNFGLCQAILPPFARGVVVLAPVPAGALAVGAGMKPGRTYSSRCPGEGPERQSAAPAEPGGAVAGLLGIVKSPLGAHGSKRCGAPQLRPRCRSPPPSAHMKLTSTRMRWLDKAC